jgi:D-arabinose 1-dehydrogenase-like Zn-dependent alcohol dehydrogenase
MQAAVVPAVNSSWLVKDVPPPQPGPNQVLVKMHASGICYTDVHQTLGHFPGPFPRILGHEPVGEIVSVAPDVTTRKSGDRVGTAWIQSTCGRCERCQQNGPEYLYEALDFVAQGKVKAIVETYPLAEAPKAYDRVAEGKARFRAVLTM